MNLKDKNLSTKIIEILTKYSVAIPNEGFLAGGAIANTIFNLFWGGNYPINDIDIFYETKRASSPNYSWDMIHTPLRTDKIVLEGDGYMVTKISYNENCSYKVLSTRRDGYLNMIEISSINNRSVVKNYEYILKGFDLNCCQVGINLENNELVYTEEFELFLKTKQLELTTLYTPAHTAIRIFKKIDELQCYCNLDKCMEILSQPLLLSRVNYAKQKGFGVYFSTKYKDLYIKYHNKIKNYFTMVKFFQHKKNVWESMYEKVNVGEDHVVNWMDPNRSIPRDLLIKWGKYKDIMWTLEPKKYKTPNETINELLELLFYNPLTLFKSYNIINGKLTKNEINKINVIIKSSSFFCKLFFFVIEDFQKCDFTISHINELNSFLKMNTWLSRDICRFKMNLQETYNLIKTIKKIYKKEGEWISDILSEILEKKDDSYNLSFKTLISEIKVKIGEHSKNFIDPTDISFIELPKGVSVIEITNDYLLQWSGHKLKNCINNSGQGYKDNIILGKLKIFIIKTPNNLSAMEIEHDGLVYKLNQVLSYCNKMTSPYHKVICDIIITELNVVSLKKNIDKKISNFEKSITLHKNLLLSLDDESTDNNDYGHGRFPPAGELF